MKNKWVPKYKKHLESQVDMSRAEPLQDIPIKRPKIQRKKNEY